MYVNEARNVCQRRVVWRPIFSTHPREKRRTIGWHITRSKSCVFCNKNFQEAIPIWKKVLTDKSNFNIYLFLKLKIHSSPKRHRFHPVYFRSNFHPSILLLLTKHYLQTSPLLRKKCESHTVNTPTSLLLAWYRHTYKIISTTGGSGSNRTFGSTRRLEKRQREEGKKIKENNH